jgi:hypothetical protein
MCLSSAYLCLPLSGRMAFWATMSFRTFGFSSTFGGACWWRSKFQTFGGDGAFGGK